MSIEALRDCVARNYVPTVHEVKAALLEISDERVNRLSGRISALEAENAALKAEAGKLREACQTLVDAVARARKSDDAVARNAGITADWDEHEDAHASLIIFENAARALLAAALQDGPDDNAAKLQENCIAYPTKLPERPHCVWLSDGRKIGIQREGGAVWLRIENAATVIPATPVAADIDTAHDAKG